MSTLKDRMQELAQAMKWDVGRIAKEAGVSSSAVSQWFGNGSKEIHSINIKPAIYLERATGFSAMWISKGELPKIAPNAQKLSPMAYGLGVLFDSIPEHEQEKRDLIFATVLQTVHGSSSSHSPTSPSVQNRRTQTA